MNCVYAHDVFISCKEPCRKVIIYNDCITMFSYLSMYDFYFFVHCAGMRCGKWDRNVARTEGAERGFAKLSEV